MPHIHSISELKNNLNQLADICLKQDEPVFLTRKGHGELVLLSLEGYERMLHYQKQQEVSDLRIEALWVSEAEARYDQIKTGKVTCRSLEDALADAHKELL